MKKFSLSLFVFFVSLTITSQTTNHGDWVYFNGKDYFFYYNNNGEGIENYNSKSIPDFTIINEKNEEGNLYVRLDAALIYKYDGSGNDANYLKVDIIIDDGDIISFKGTIEDTSQDETRIYLSSQSDGPRFVDLFEDMKSGRNIYVRTTGAGDPKVYKYSLSGFTSGYNKMYNEWVNWVDNNKNPFDSKNPFRN